MQEDFDLKEWIDARVRTTPWWALSIGFHAAVLACLGLITFADRVIAKDPLPMVIPLAKRAPRLTVPDERPRGTSDQPALDPTRPASADEAPPLDFPEAKLADHFETASDRPDGHDVEGDDLSFLHVGGPPGTDHVLRGRSLEGGPGVTDAIGPGGGGGRPGRYGRPGGGGVENLRARAGKGNAGCADAVIYGLYWLARHQGADGGWHAETFSHGCAPGAPCGGAGYGQFDVGLTGLSLLAFLGAGYTSVSRDAYEDPYTHQRSSFGACVRKAIRYLRESQDAEGCYGPRVGEFMYNHAIAALAMVEAYG
ncbi:MAG TPA: hypothetical protein VHF22_12485, partial [Planctomycetota bacterium]|nr:hypothetical protein [Planctomycetota bacterium]